MVKHKTLLFLCFIILLSLISPPSVLSVGENWLTGWHYRKLIRIDNNNATQELTNYPIKIVFDSFSLIQYGRMREDCGDLRFTLSDGKTLLTYWLNTTTINTSETEVYVRVSIPAGSYTYIYMYYGNPNAIDASSTDAKPRDTLPIYSQLNYTFKFPRETGSEITHLSLKTSVDSRWGGQSKSVHTGVTIAAYSYEADSTINFPSGTYHCYLYIYTAYTGSWSFTATIYKVLVNNTVVELGSNINTGSIHSTGYFTLQCDVSLSSFTLNVGEKLKVEYNLSGPHENSMVIWNQNTRIVFADYVYWSKYGGNINTLYFSEPPMHIWERRTVDCSSVSEIDVVSTRIDREVYVLHGTGTLEGLIDATVTGTYSNYTIVEGKPSETELWGIMDSETLKILYQMNVKLNFTFYVEPDLPYSSPSYIINATGLYYYYSILDYVSYVFDVEQEVTNFLTINTYTFRFYDYASFIDNNTVCVVEGVGEKYVGYGNLIVWNLTEGYNYHIYLRNSNNMVYDFGTVYLGSSTDLVFVVKPSAYDASILPTSYYKVGVQRTSNTTIHISWQDTSSTGSGVSIYINFKNNTNAYNTTIYSKQGVLDWDNADNNTEYIVIITFIPSGVTYKYPAPLQESAKPFIDLSFLGDWGINGSYVVPIILLLFLAGTFTFISAAAGLFVVLGFAGLFMVWGWLPANYTLLLILACMGVIWATYRLKEAI